MGKYRLIFQDEAVKDLEIHRKIGDKVVLKRISRIFAELEEHPQTGIGNPERLRFGLSGLWSRRINLEHRIVYSIKDEVVEVTVVSARGHY